MKWNLIQSLGDEQEERRVSKEPLRQLKKMKKKTLEVSQWKQQDLDIKPSQA